MSFFFFFFLFDALLGLRQCKALTTRMNTCPRHSGGSPTSGADRSRLRPSDSRMPAAQSVLQTAGRPARGQRPRPASCCPGSRAECLADAQHLPAEPRGGPCPPLARAVCHLVAATPRAKAYVLLLACLISRRSSPADTSIERVVGNEDRFQWTPRLLLQPLFRFANSDSNPTKNSGPEIIHASKCEKYGACPGACVPHRRAPRG